MRLQRVESCEILVLQHLLHLLDVGEVAGRNLMFSLQTIVNGPDVLDQILLLAVLSEHAGHVFSQLSDNVSMDFSESGALDKVVQFA